MSNGQNHKITEATDTTVSSSIDKPVIGNTYCIIYFYLAYEEQQLNIVSFF
jgi:hypothetical protein